MLTRATFTHPHPGIGLHTDAHLVVSLRGERDATASRPRLVVIPVVDVSGSMGSSAKLTLVTRALAHLSEYLTDRDQLGLVTFHSVAAVPVAVQCATTEALRGFTSALSSLRPQASTNLYEGLRLGLEQAAAAQDTDEPTLTRLVVLTDGRTNVGATSPAALTRLLADRPAGTSVSFLGVGSDCDHELLGELAEVGEGNYGFIETAQDAPTVLGTEIGGLLDVEAHDVTVEVTTTGRYCALAGDRPVGAAGSRVENTLTTHVTQVLRGGTRNVVVPVTLHGAGTNHARPVTCAVVTVRSHIDGQVVEVTLRPKVKFVPASAGASVPDPESLEAAELAQIAQSIQDARRAARAGDFVAAQAAFSTVDATTATALSLRSAVAGSYASAQNFAGSGTTLAGASAAVRGSLSGADAAFTSVASSSVGMLYTDAQRRTAARAAAATGTLTARAVQPVEPAPGDDASTEAGAVDGPVDGGVSQ